MSFIPVLFIYATIGVTGFVYVNKYYFKQAITQKSNEIKNISRAINDWLISRISEIIQVSSIPALKREGYDKNNSATIKKYLKNWRSRFAFIYSDIYLIDLNGNYWSSSNKTGKLNNRIFISYFTGEIPKYFYMGPALGEPSLNREVMVASPIIHNGEVTGILAGVIPIDVISRMIGFFTFSEFDSYMLVDQFGYIIAHSDKQLVGKRESYAYGTEFTKLTEHRGNMVFVNVLKTTWKFVTFQPTNTLLLPMRRINYIIIFILISILVIILLISYISALKIVKPILELTRGVEKIMAGDYRQHINIKTQDEMKTLAESFNRLSDRMIQIRTDDRFIFLGHISARMAHEMRKPLHIIQLAAQTMQTKKEYVHRHIDLILKEVENADRFLKEILNFAKPEILNLQRYSLETLWDKILPKYKLIAENLNISIQYEKNGDIPEMYIDIIKIEEVFSNLLDNAFDATVSALKDGKIEEKNAVVSVKLKFKENSGIYITITDSGCGFDEGKIDRFFDPYYTTKDNGTGLGLSISYRILTTHGAKITLRNTQEGHGEVEIVFPL